jgi:heat shock protein HtpX
MKRILLFIATNIAVLVVMSVILSLLGVDRFLTRSGLNLPMLLVFSLVVGFTGSIISLLMSKSMAKWSTGARVIETPMNGTEAWLLQTVGKLAQRAGIGMPEVAVYDGEPNAFATGAFKDSALVAVSTGLLQGMTQEEVEAVLGHEVAHIANGDMVTMTLIQGVVNTFVVFLSRVVGFFVDSALRRNNVLRSRHRLHGDGAGVPDRLRHRCFDDRGLVLAPARIPRRRRFGPPLGTPQPMINALARLGGFSPEGLPQNMAALGISDKPGFMELFSTHPPLEQRIAALRGQR